MKEYGLCIASRKKVVCDSDNLRIIQMQKNFYQEEAERDGLNIEYVIYNSKGELID